MTWGFQKVFGRPRPVRARRAPAGSCRETHFGRFSAQRQSFSRREIHSGRFSAHPAMCVRGARPARGADRRHGRASQRRAFADTPPWACPLVRGGAVHFLRTFVPRRQFRGGRGASFLDFCTPRAAVRCGWVSCNGSRGKTPRLLHRRGFSVSAGRGPVSSRGGRMRRPRRSGRGARRERNLVPQSYKTRKKMHWKRSRMPRTYKSPENAHRRLACSPAGACWSGKRPTRGQPHETCTNRRRSECGRTFREPVSATRLQLRRPAICGGFVRRTCRWTNHKQEGRWAHLPIDP